MKSACVKARVVRKSRGQQCPYGFDSRPKHIIPLGRSSERDFCFVSCLGTPTSYLYKNIFTMHKKRTKEDFEQAAKESFSIAGMCRYLNLKPAGGNYKLMHDAIVRYNIDIGHFTGQGWNTNLKFKPFQEKPLMEILAKDSAYQSHKLKRRLILEGVKLHVCESCRLTEWLGKPIPLELHHVNGNNSDNRLENLLLLCPNCHALTDSYRGKNKKDTNYSKE